MVWLPIQWYQSATIKCYRQYNAEGVIAEQGHDSKEQSWNSQVANVKGEEIIARYLLQNGNLPVPQSLFLLLHVPPFSTLRADVLIIQCRSSGGPHAADPPFVTFPLPCLHTESVTGSYTQFLLLCLPKMIPALQETPFHIFFHGRIPESWPGHGTCRRLICSNLSWVEKKIKLWEVEMNVWPF